MQNDHLHTDRELFSLIAGGDEEAFGRLFDLYTPVIYSFTLKITGEPEVAKGMVQETFLRIWLGRDQLETIEKPSAWIYKIAANQCYKLLRRKVLSEKIPEIAADENPYDRINLRELSALVGEAVSTLSGQRRKIYLLSRENGKTIAQIAEELQLSPSTVKNTLVSALRSVREYLQDRGYFLPLVVLWWLK